MRFVLGFYAATASIGCTSIAPAVRAPEPATPTLVETTAFVDVPVVPREPDPIVVFAGDSSSPVVSPPAPPRLDCAEPPGVGDRETLALLCRLANGDLPASGVVHPRRGLVVVGYFSDASGENIQADAQGIVRTSEHLCGFDVAGRIEWLREYLRGRLTVPDMEPECWGNRCTFQPVGEFDVRRTLRLTPTGEIESIVDVEVSLVEDSQERLAWAERQRAEMSSRSCPSRP